MLAQDWLLALQAYLITYNVGDIIRPFSNGLAQSIAVNRQLYSMCCRKTQVRFFADDRSLVFAKAKKEEQGGQ
jgi:hypothetical protein